MVPAHAAHDRRHVVLVPRLIPRHDPAHGRQHVVRHRCTGAVFDVVEQRHHIATADVEKLGRTPLRVNVFIQLPADFRFRDQTLLFDVALEPVLSHLLPLEQIRPRGPIARMFAERCDLVHAAWKSWGGAWKRLQASVGAIWAAGAVGKPAGGLLGRCTGSLSQGPLLSRGYLRSMA